MICPNCGNVNDGRFCSLCGNLLEVQKKKSPNLKIIITAGVVLLSVVIVLIAVIVGFSQREDNRAEQNTEIVTERHTERVSEKADEKPSERVTEEPTTKPHIPQDIYGYNIPSYIEIPYEYCYYEPMRINLSSACYLNSESDMNCEKLFGPVDGKTLVYRIGYSQDMEWSLVYCAYENIFGWLKNQNLAQVTAAEVTTVFEDSYIIMDGKKYQIDGACALKTMIDIEGGIALRNGPDDNSRMIFNMEYGAVITEGCVYHYDSDWVYVVYDDGIGTYCGFADLSELHAGQTDYSTENHANRIYEEYCKVLDDLYDSGDMFCEYMIYDMDNDGTTELFYKKGTCRADIRFIVYTYENGAAVRIGEFGGDVVYTTETAYGVYSYYSQMNWEIMYKVTKVGNSLQRDTVFERSASEYSPPDDMYLLQVFDHNDDTGVSDFTYSR